jgi:hypothetical protein
VGLNLENLIKIEIGGWGTNIKVSSSKDVKVSLSTKSDGSTTVFFR